MLGLIISMIIVGLIAGAVAGVLRGAELTRSLLAFSRRQRLKIARELTLSAKKSGRKLYVLDEPTTGLHLEDIRKLATVLDRLVDAGHTVVLIEHNLDVIKLADWVIDLGPDGGSAGGRLVAMGRPEEVAAIAESHTGRWLAPLLGAGAMAEKRTKTSDPRRARTRLPK